MTPVVISRIVDVINSKDEAALSTMMTPALASMYTSALKQMSESGYDIKIDIKSLNNVKVGGTSIKSGQPKAFDTTVPFETRSQRFSYYGAGPHIIADQKIPLSKDMDVSSELPNFIAIYKQPIRLEFWSTAQARVAISLSQHGKVVDQDEGYMPIVVSMASPTYPQISEAPTILSDGQIMYIGSDPKIPFEWRVSDLFLNITNKEIRAIEKVRVL
ncbi:hypothetical protein LPJ77_003523 [Coemansia sp. RSA 2523]|nr:hypothetical protein LPJ77_003523 [Coemansia sp. RSA 2523]KAJ2167824.1 hypothetical protein GGH15_001863 [Coemansia sp. RSA 562]KAJ2230643.1 hypothetical protein EV180_000846 [Coemansia sp. RSA 518]KAJ2258239.1 hypothetical protein GGH98_000323 [Coemansia sp. RSA 454]KAJ2270685.1 hypothetical protein J3F81_003783 [Coemansia sp. RSA 371]